jgi:hypothetical protein
MEKHAPGRWIALHKMMGRLFYPRLFLPWKTHQQSYGASVHKSIHTLASRDVIERFFDRYYSDMPLSTCRYMEEKTSKFQGKNKGFFVKNTIKFK